MKTLKDKELNNIYGGGISGTVISSIVRGAEYLLDLGRSLGSSIRRFITGNLC